MAAAGAPASAAATPGSELFWGLVSTLLLKRPVKDNIILFPIVLVLYAPLIYYTDLWMYKRHVRKKAAG